MKRGIKSLTILAILSLTITGCSSNAPVSSFSSNSSNTSSSQEPNKYTITWKNYDGAVLEIDEGVIEGEVPTYDGLTPIKPSTNQYHYVFSGWSPSVSEATSDREYFATYTEETRTYTVTWKNYDGTVIRVDKNIPYGTVPSDDGVSPTKEPTESKVYSFAGWSPEIKAIEGDVAFTATYDESPRKYTITWKNEGEVIKTDEVAYGEVPVYSGDTPIKESDAQFMYQFNGWYPIPSEVKGDATYSATYLSSVRSYTITWKNYDGSILEVDQFVNYGETPSYDGETPTRKVGQGFTYTFSGWSPNIESVCGDQTYVATYDGEPTFCFNTWDYDLEEGYTLDDINGAPWINPQITGELDKIKRPSLKDDFYTYVNYDDIKSGAAKSNPFADCYNDVYASIDSIYDGTCVPYTTNGDFLYHSLSKVEEGDATSVNSYIDDLSIDNYLSSKEAFLYHSSIYRLVPSENGIEIQYNDGYVNRNVGINTVWFYARSYPEYLDVATGIVRDLDSAFNIGLTDKELADVYAVESNLTYRAYAYQYQDPNTVYAYTVGELAWPQLRAALLDLGFTNNDKIAIHAYYENLFNVFFNSFLPAYKTAIENMIKARYMFDSRFFMGPDNYQPLNKKLSDIGLFPREEYMYTKNGHDLAIRMARACFPILDEQIYIEQKGSEETKAQVEVLINEILQAYEEMANEVTWLSESTQERMLKKLKAMKYACCYSDETKQFPKIELDNLENVSLANYLRAYGVATIKAVNSNTLDVSGYFDYYPSYTVNAFYSPRDNAFIILNALASGLYSSCPEEKYSMLGMVIGHEITHAFDAGGAQYDENGQENNWWTSMDKKVFEVKNKKLSDFYDNIALKKDYYVRGDDVKEEATADMGGLKVAIRLGKKIPNFDFEKFFISYAKLWKRPSMDISEIQASAESDFHPFPYLRGNVSLAQFDEFINTFDIKPGDGMYIPEDQRVKIW